MALCAPVSISVYDREQHLRKCISSLLQNPEAPHTVLYIFSDAAKPGDEEKIERVRRYVGTIKGFSEVRAVFQETNGYIKNMKESRQIPLRDFGRLIRMEDDIVVSPCFLGYMNEALDRFECDQRIFSISGYSPDFGAPNPDRPFLSKDFSAWGYATWRDRNITECVERNDYYQAMCRNQDARKASAKLHPLMVPMLRLIAQGKVNPGDYKLSAYQFLSGKFSLKPGTSLIRNIGFDGSGMGGNGAKTGKFDTDFSRERPKIPTSLDYDPAIDQALFGFYFPPNMPSTTLSVLKLNLAALVPSSFYGKARRLKAAFLKRR